MPESRSRPDRYTRSRTDRVLAGVCGGLADYLDVDATLVRVAWVLVTIFIPPGGLIAYALLWLLAPENGEVHEHSATSKAADEH